MEADMGQPQIPKLWKENWGAADRISQRLFDLMMEELARNMDDPVQVLGGAIHSLINLLAIAGVDERRPDHLVHLDEAASLCLSSMILSHKKRKP